MKKYRHGDVILTATELPNGVKPKTGNVVAEGEVTGHAHRINGGRLATLDDTLFVIPEKKPHMTHEEHKRIDLSTLPDNWGYEVTIQRQYDDELEWRK